ncbi:hypothetical protein P7H19_11420 [Paenibacillus larvae]|nr:hypothetical protein [Paenibacillus larvae]MDT2236778.1 hypothetical protein [Paenibacillus larvae]
MVISSTEKEVAERTVKRLIKKYGYKIDRSIGFDCQKGEDKEDRVNYGGNHSFMVAAICCGNH